MNLKNEAKQAVETLKKLVLEVVKQNPDGIGPTDVDASLILNLTLKENTEII